MFCVNRERLIAGLEVLRQSLCPYRRPGHDCDCKYGVALRGEQTGCPEVREVIGLLSAMSDGEFAIFVKRAGGLDVDVLRAAINAK
jgi:hypothetical protein